MRLVEMSTEWGLKKAAERRGENIGILNPFQPFYGLHLFPITNPGPLYGLFQDFNRAIIGCPVHRIGMPILSAVSKTESGRIPEAHIRPVYELRQKGQGSNRFGPDALEGR